MDVAKAPADDRQLENTSEWTIPSARRRWFSSVDAHEVSKLQVRSTVAETETFVARLIPDE